MGSGALAARGSAAVGAGTAGEVGENWVGEET